MPNATEEAFDKVIDTNLKGVFFLSQLFGGYLKANKVEGNILNVGSSSCLRPATSAYTLSQVGNTRPDAWTCQEPCPLWCYGERDSARAYGHPDVVERWSR